MTLEVVIEICQKKVKLNNQQVLGPIFNYCFWVDLEMRTVLNG